MLRSPLVLVLPIVLLGCTREYASLRVDVDDTGPTGFVVEAPAEDLTFIHPVEYEKGLSLLQQRADELGAPLQFTMGENITMELSSALGDGGWHKQSVAGGPDLIEPEGIKMPIGQYLLTADCSRDKQMNGCAGGRFVPAMCNVRVNTTEGGKDSLRFDLHVGSWRGDGGRLCLGFYESGPRKLVNYCTCFPNKTDVWQAYDDVKGQISNAFLALGASAGVAWVLSEVATPVVIGGMAI